MIFCEINILNTLLEPQPDSPPLSQPLYNYSMNHYTSIVKGLNLTITMFSCVLHLA